MVRNSIFVKIPSYNDPECVPTIHDLFTKAAHPQNIFLGICFQYDDITTIPDFIDFEFKSNIRTSKFHVSESEGISWARARTEELYKNETFSLQIDAHMRFEKNWDVQLIDIIHQLTTDSCPKPVLTAIAPEYDLDGTLHPFVSSIGVYYTSEDLPFTKGVDRFDEATSPDRPIPGAFISAHFVFSYGFINTEIPNDPKLNYYDEIPYSARLWTNGYDIFHPHQVILYHHHIRSDNRNNLPHRNNSFIYDKQAMLRAKSILTGMSSQNTDEQSKFQLGINRSIDEYQEYCGVNFLLKEISRHTIIGLFKDMKYFTQNKTNNSASAIKKKSFELNRLTTLKNRKIFVQLIIQKAKNSGSVLSSLFDQAQTPENLRVGICMPRHENYSQAFKKINQNYLTKIYVVESTSSSISKARLSAQTFQTDEYYTLRISDKALFDKDWDSRLIKLYEGLSGKGNVLLSTKLIPGRHAYQFNQGLVFLHPESDEFQQSISLSFGLYNIIPPAPRIGGYVSSDLIFAKSEIINQLLAIEHKTQLDDDASLSALYWLHGCNFFHPNESIASLNPKYQSITFSQNGNNSLTSAKSGMLIESINNLEYYTPRNIYQYEKFAGISFSTLEIMNHAKIGLY